MNCGEPKQAKVEMMFDLDSAIQKWTAQFHKHRAFDQGAVREMELHLRDSIEDLRAQGTSEKEAFQMAVKEFGEIPAMADEEYYTIRSKTTIMSMIRTTLLRSYFKTSFRSLVKNPLSSFINIFGLAVAIGICILVYSFFVFDQNLDQFHEKKNEVYLSTFVVDRDGSEEQYGLSPAPLGEMLADDFSSIKSVCRILDRNIVTKNGDKVFHEQLRYVDKEFLSLFTFPLKWGVPSSLGDLNSVVISQKMSEKYFGKENPIGQTLQLIFGDNLSKNFTVSGVANPFPNAHIIEFDFLINFQNLRNTEPNFDVSSWQELVNATLIEVESKEDLRIVQEGMSKYRSLQNAVEDDWGIISFDFIPLANLHFESSKIKNDISSDTNVEARQGLPIIALLMLALACLNYMNIAIVSAAKRLKEIGLRKVIGANKRLVVFQFLCENIFLTFFALVLGLLLAYFVFLPWFSRLTGDPITFNLLDLNLWIFMISTVLFTGIISGLYPALHISKFDTVKIFKGSVKIGKKGMLTKIFLAVQLVLTCIGITCAVVFNQNNAFQNSRSWGYDSEETFFTPVPNQAGFTKLKNALAQNANVKSLAGSSHHLGKNKATRVVHTEEREYEVSELSVSANYFPTMGLSLLEGRFFRENYESDRRAVVVNEHLIQRLALSDPIGDFFKIDSANYEIVGVVKDFHMYDFHSRIEPTIFLLADESNYRYLSVKVERNSMQEFYADLQEQWVTAFPEIPFQGGYQRDVWSQFFVLVDTAEEFYRVLAFMAILLASLGLYGLVTLNVAGRIKEFSIRKTLGASSKSIAYNILKQYLILFAVSLIAGAPISHLMAESSLNMLYHYPMPMSYSGVAIAMGILIFILLAVISTQIRKVSKTNPVEGLKVE